MHNTYWLAIERNGKAVRARVPVEALPNLSAIAARVADCDLRILVDVEDPDCPDSAVGSSAVVFSLGGGACIAAAEIYASGAGRPCRNVTCWQELVDVVGGGGVVSAFVFIPESVFTVEAIGVFIESACEAKFAVGFFPVADDPVEALSASIRLLAPRVPKPDRLPHLLFFSEQAPDTLPFVVYRDAAKDNFYALASAGADAIVFDGHGNGACFKLGTSALCVQADHLRPKDVASTRRMLPCQAGGPCLQHRVADKRGASAINADMLVLLTCWGWVPYDSYIDQHFSLSQALFRAGSARAIVTAYTVSVSSWSHGVAVRDFLLEGGSAGQLAHALNELLQPGTRPYLCLGDPEIAIATPAVDGVEDDDSEDPQSDEHGEQQEKTEEFFLSLSSEEGIQTFLLRRILAESDRPSQDVVEALSLSNSDPNLHSTLECVAKLLAKRIARFGGAFWKHYVGTDGLQFGENRPLPGTHACGARWWASDSLPNARLIGARRLCICSRCGVVADLDATLTSQPRLDYASDGGIELHLTQIMPEPLLVTCGIEASGEVEGATGPVMLLETGSRLLRMPELTASIKRGVQGFVVVLLWPGGFSTMRLSIMLGARLPYT